MNLTAEPKALTRQLFSLLQPGGTLLIGNFNPSLPRATRWIMEFICEWDLIYRDDDDMLATAESLPTHEIKELEILREDEGINSFLRVTRAGALP